jgi:hypothetical protein
MKSLRTVKFSIPSAYRRSLRFAAIMQVVAIVLTGFVDDDGSFIPTVLAGWVAFWIGVVALTKFRITPTKPELVAVRYGPMGVFIAIFTAGQYL